MKFESDERNFSLNMNSFEGTERRNEFENAGEVIKENKPLFFSVIAVAIALANLAFGLFINLSSKILTNVLESQNYHFTVVMLVIAVVMSVVSVALGILTLVYYSKSEKRSLDKTAVFAAILSFALSIAALTLDIVGLFIW